MIVVNSNGAAIECRQIHDLWHLATAESPAKTLSIRNAITGKLINGEKAILDVWTQAHAMHHQLCLQAERNDRPGEYTGATLGAHFHDNVSADVDRTKYEFIQGTFNDPKAMAELDTFHEVWDRIDFRLLGPKLARLHELKALEQRGRDLGYIESLDLKQEFRQLHAEICALIYDAWYATANAFADSQYLHVDLKTLEAAEAEPEGAA